MRDEGAELGVDSNDRRLRSRRRGDEKRFFHALDTTGMDSDLVHALDRVKACTADPSSSFDAAVDAYTRFVASYDSSSINYFPSVFRFLTTELVVRAKRADDADDVRRASKKASSLLERALRCTLSKGALTPTSKKWSSLMVVNSMMRLNFRLGMACASLVRYVAAPSFVPLDSFPPSDRACYLYYFGRLQLMNNKFKEARKALTKSYELLVAMKSVAPDATSSTRVSTNVEKVLSYLVPTNVLLGVFPSNELVANHAFIRTVYVDLCRAIECGSACRVRRELEAHQSYFHSKRIYLTLATRAPYLAYRSIFRIVFVLRGKPSTLSFEDVSFALNEVSDDRKKVDADDAHDRLRCVVANLIDLGFVKGQLVHQRRGKIVLSKTNAFPPLS